MSEYEQGSGGTVFEEATAAANAEILSALDGAGGADDSPAHADPSGDRVAAASAPMVGHGVIRLRSQSAPRLEDGAAGAPTPEAAATREPVGHGTIRLLAGSPAPAEEAAQAAPDAVAPPAPEAAAPRVAPRAPEAPAPQESDAAAPGAPRVATSPAPAASAPGAPRVAASPAPAPPAAAPPTPEAAAPPEPVGHGRVRFVDRSLQLDPSATDAAEADIFSVLSATT